MRLSSIVPIALAFVAAGGCAYLAATASVRLLETNSQNDVNFELELAGHDWVEVQADGLQVVLSGVADTEAMRFNARSVAGTVVDSARVIDNMNVKEAQKIVAPRFSIEILRNDEGVSLYGLIPASTDRERLQSLIARVARGVALTDFLETADFPAPDGWNEALNYALVSLRDLPRSKLSVSADRVNITAITDSAVEKARLEGALARSAPEGVRTELAISAPRPVISPFTLRFVHDGAVARFDACSVDTSDAQAMILAAASDAGLEGKAECRLGLGTPTREWGQAGAAAVQAVGALGSGSVTITDTDVSLIATEGTDETLFNQTSATLERALPAIFTLTAVLPKPVIETEEGPAELVATRSPEGAVQVRGHLGETLAREAVSNYAKARFGAGQVYLAAEDHSALPRKWSLRALAGLAALAELNNGSVTVTSDTVEVRGVTGNANARTAVSQVLSDQLGEGQSFSINVTYEETLDPTANVPTPQECLAKVIALGEEKKISFEPGSTTLDGPSRTTISQIAEVLLDCPEFEIQVAGHTDSQGREEMNLNLSQSRAEAVVSALRSERISWRGLRAKGFGETAPIADNDTAEGREANRRIEFSLVLPEPTAPDSAPDTDADGSAANQEEAQSE